MREKERRENMEKKGIEYLRNKLRARSGRVRHKFKQYDMKYIDNDRSITISDELRANYRAVLGWCTKSVDSIADRLVFREFDDDVYEINQIFQMNNPDVFFDSAILSALIGSCSFIYISEGVEGIPRLQVIEADKATGVLDPITGLLTEGYAVLKSDERGNPSIEAYFEPFRTTIISQGIYQAFNHSVPYPLLVPIIHRPDAVRPFGRSRITRAGMYYQKYAKRALERSDVTAEFYSFPQKYILGMETDAEKWDTWKATVSSMLRIDKDSDGGHPVVGQFTTSSMSPFMEQLRMAAAGFAGESGLTLDDLGFVSDNPSSSEAIKASHETLRIMAKKAQRCFSSGFLNVAFLACCLRDDYPYYRHEFTKIKVKWENVFEVDASGMGLLGDAIVKINQAIPDYFDKGEVRDMLGR
jgi:hypothetical protein